MNNDGIPLKCSETENHIRPSVFDGMFLVFFFDTTSYSHSISTRIADLWSAEPLLGPLKMNDLIGLCLLFADEICMACAADAQLVVEKE